MPTQKQLRDQTSYQKAKAAVKSSEAALWKGEAKRIKDTLMEERKEGMWREEKREIQAVALKGENSFLCDLMKIFMSRFSSFTCKLKAQHRIKEGR